MWRKLSSIAGRHVAGDWGEGRSPAGLSMRQDAGLNLRPRAPAPPQVKPVSAKNGYKKTGFRPSGRPSRMEAYYERARNEQLPSNRLDPANGWFVLTRMKHSQLHAVAHNFTDSLASGLGFVIGYCETHVFADAACNPDGFLVVDFLTGQLDEGTATDQLVHALPIFRNGFEGFCQKHGASNSDFAEFKARFEAGRRGNMYSITITDARGRRSSIDYEGIPGRRVKMLDDQGHVAPNRTILDN
ncbi:MAG: hypothetical protein AAGE13_11555 [Pseudomonadota bacterium]